MPEEDQIQVDVTTIGSYTLLVLVLANIFLVPLFPTEWHRLLYGVMHSIIFITAALSLRNGWKRVLQVAIAVTALEWIAFRANVYLLFALSEVVATCFVLFIIARLIHQIASTKNVTSRTILAAINGYLLLGLTLSIMVGFIVRSRPDAYRFPAGSPLDPTFADLEYYGFITLTTVGYGDITPVAPIARSLAVFNGIAGQIYVAVIIALLVGKFAARRP